MASKKKSAKSTVTDDESIIQDERYRLLFETSQDAIMFLDKERFFDCNPATLKMFGLTKEIFIKLHPSEISPPRQPNGKKSREEADNLISEAFERGNLKFDWVHRRSDGEDFAVTVWLTAIKLEGRDVLQATVREISAAEETALDLEAHRLKLQMLLDDRSSDYRREFDDRIKAESELRKLIKAVETTFDAIALFDMDMNFVYANSSFCNLAGVDSKDLVAKNASQFIPSESMEAIMAQINRNLDGMDVERFEVKVHNAKGQELWVEIAGSVLFNKEGEPDGLLAIIHDATERRAIQKALKESEEKFKMLVERSLDGILIIQDAKVAYMNPALLKLSGYSMEEQLGREFIENVAPEAREAVLKIYQSRMSGKKIPQIYETVLITKYGARVPIEVNAGIMDYQGRPADFVYLRDLTERKMAEKDIRIIKEHFEYVLGATNTGFDLIDEDFNVVYVDPKWAEKLGDYSGRKCYEYFMGKSGVCEKCAIPNAMKTGKSIVSEEYLEKEKRYIEVHTIPLRGEDGRNLVAEFNIDITERKKMLNTLQESEEKFRNLAEHSPNMIFINRMGKVVYANKICEEIMGYTSEEFTSSDFNLMDIIHKDYHGLIRENLQKHFNGQEVKPYEYKLITKRGEVIDAIINTKTIEYSGDKAILGIITDVTDIKKAEETLRSLSNQLKSINENLADGMVYQINGGKDGKSQVFTYLSPAVERMRGIKLEDALANPQLIYDQVVEEDRDIMRKTRAETFTKREKMDMRLRIRLPDGQVKWHRFLAVPSEDAEGNVIWNGIELDITEEKNREDALRESELVNRSIVDSSPWGMYIYELEEGNRLVFKGHNAAADRITGVDNSKFIGKAIEEAFPQLKKTEAPKRYREVAKTGKMWHSSEIDYDEHGIKGAFEVTAFRISPKQIIVAFQNISDRLKMEEQITKDQRKISEIVESITDGFVAFDSEMNYTYVNSKGAELLGRKPDDLIGKNYWTEFPDARGTPFADAYLKALKEKKSHVFENYYEPWDRWFENRIYPTEDGIAIYFTETTERKRAERKLSENEMKYRLLMEKANDAIFLADAETGKLIDVNEKACEMTGRTRDELVGMHQSKLHPPEEAKKYKEIFRRHVQNGSAIHEDIYIIHKDGHLIPVSISASVFEIQGRIVNQGIFHDLTDRINAENALREADEKVSTIFKSIEDLVFGFDKDGNFISYHTPAGGLLYMPEEAFIGKKYSDVMPPHVSNLIEKALQKNMKGQSMEFEYLLPLGGKDRFFSAKMSPIFAKDEFNGSVAVVRDMTARMETEQELLSSREQLNALFQASTNGIGVEKDGKLFFVNPSFISMFGYSNPDEVIGQPLGIIVDEKDRKRVKGYTKLRLKGEAPPKYEFTGVRKDGSTFEAEASVSAYQIGGEDYYVGFVQDITDRKLSLKKMQESEARFRNMAENIHDGLTIIENGKVSYINDRAVEIYGYPKEELMHKSHLDLVIPEDREQLRAIIENARKSNQRIGELEFWVQGKDGSRRYVRTRLSTSGEGEGRSEFIITTDITARKVAEDETKRRMMKFLLEDGRMYMVKEFRPEMSVEAFNDLLNLEYFGMVMSRTPKKDVTRLVKGGFEYLWLGDRDDGKELFDEILAAVSELGGKSAILIERLDYLVFKYGFKETMALIYRLRDIIYLKEQIVILSLDPSTMAEDQLSTLQKEMGEIELRQTPKPPEELFEIAQVIYDRNSTGIKPSFSEVGEELKMSKPTCRKRVRRLIAAGYAVEVSKGNRKVLELTQKGRSLFFK